MSEAHIEVAPAPIVQDHGHGSHHAENLKFAWWLFLASEVIIFTVLIAAYLVFSVDHRDMIREIHQEIGVLLVSANTFLLLTSSWTMVMGLRQLQRGDTRGLSRWIGATAALGTLFVILQVVETRELNQLGITLDSDFGARFFAPTMLHGAHVIAGVIWALSVALKARRGRYSPQNYIGVEVFGLYWHFVDVIWIFIFTIIYLL
ncbi:MAG TPA: cytochrome c oxidase subunit 3 [Candidatus Limnocylindrales bacterium]|jgi:cytochrome c oxidase subunit I+III|nr:cytochrome c oxidase subunit 3 [Candidatus Limnocylindrales bacterium]